MMLRIIFLVLACLTVLPQPAFAHGLTATTGMVYGAMGVLIAAFAAACVMPGKFWQACLTWLAAIAGGIACVVLVPMASEALSGIFRRDDYGSGYNSFWRVAGDVFELILPATCIVTSFTIGVYVSHALRRTPSLSRFYTWLGICWLGLVALAILAPAVTFVFFPGYGDYGAQGTYESLRRGTLLKDFCLLLLLGAGVFYLGLTKLSADNKLGLRVISLPAFGYLLGDICDRTGLTLVRDVFWFVTLYSPIGLLVFLIIWKRRKKKRAAE